MTRVIAIVALLATPVGADTATATLHVTATIGSSVTVTVEGCAARAEFVGVDPQLGLAWVETPDGQIDLDSDSWVAVCPVTNDSALAVR